MFEDLDRHIGRLRRLLMMGLTMQECHLQVMTGDRPPTEEEFLLAYKAAEILDGKDRKEAN